MIRHKPWGIEFASPAVAAAVLAIPAMVAAVEAGEAYDRALTKFQTAPGFATFEADFAAKEAARKDWLEKTRAALALLPKATEPKGV